MCAPSLRVSRYICLAEMRTKRRGWLQPRQHFEPLLAFLNSQRVPSGRRDQLNALIHHGYPKKGSTARRALERKLKDRLVRRVRYAWWQHLAVARAFWTYTRKFDSDPHVGLNAWHEVWQFLQNEAPAIKGRIRPCGWCARLFWSLRRRDRHCSSLCRQVAHILAGQEQEVANLIVEENRVRDWIGNRGAASMDLADDPNYKLLHSLYQRIVMPVRSNLPGHFSFPTDCANPVVFRGMWESPYLFGQLPTVKKRVAECSECRQLYWRHDLRMKVCSRTCRRASHHHP
jgi:hypothetical protein